MTRHRPRRRRGRRQRRDHHDHRQAGVVSPARSPSPVVPDRHDSVINGSRSQRDRALRTLHSYGGRPSLEDGSCSAPSARARRRSRHNARQLGGLRDFRLTFTDDASGRACRAPVDGSVAMRGAREACAPRFAGSLLRCVRSEGRCDNPGAQTLASFSPCCHAGTVWRRVAPPRRLAAARAGATRRRSPSSFAGRQRRADSIIAPGRRARDVRQPGMDVRSHNMTSDPHPEHNGCPEISTVGSVAARGRAAGDGQPGAVRTCGFPRPRSPPRREQIGQGEYHSADGFRGRIVVLGRQLVDAALAVGERRASSRTGRTVGRAPPCEAPRARPPV